MSRAFVKEPYGDQVIDQRPGQVHIAHVIHVTQAGLRPLQEKAAGLLVRRKSLAGTESAKNKKQLMYIDRDLRYYEERIRRAVLIDPADQPKDVMHIGAVVEVETPEGRRMTYAVVGRTTQIGRRAETAGSHYWLGIWPRPEWGVDVCKRPAGEVELTIATIR